MERSYAFDPCSIDGSDQEEVTLDSWKPSVKKDNLVMSEWRQTQNANSHDLSPGIDELKKIAAYLKKKKSDSDIMKAFGISSETLVAIKRGCYSPVDGISLDNQSKIHKEFVRLQKNLDKLKDTLLFIGEIMFTDDEMHKEFKKKLGLKPKKAKTAEETDDEEEDEELAAMA